MMRNITIEQNGVKTTIKDASFMNITVDTTSGDNQAKLNLEFYCNLSPDNIEKIRGIMDNNYSSSYSYTRGTSSVSYYEKYNDVDIDEHIHYPNDDEDCFDSCTSQEITW